MSGKTTVWQAGVQRAIDQSSIVLTCRPSQAERELPFSALGDLLDRIDDQVLSRLARSATARSRSGVVARGRVVLGLPTSGPSPCRSCRCYASSASRPRSWWRSTMRNGSTRPRPTRSDSWRADSRPNRSGCWSRHDRSDGPAVTFDHAVAEGRRQAIRLQGCPSTNFTSC